MQSITQEIREYNKMHAGHNDFYTSDIKSIYDAGIADGEITSIIEAALKVGYVRGYNKAISEAHTV